MYEVDFISWEEKYWLAFLWAFEKFDSLSELDDYLNFSSSEIIEEYIQERKKGLKIQPEGFLPLDEEDRSYMQADFQKVSPQRKHNLLKVLKSEAKKHKEDKKQLTFRLSVSDIEKIKEMAQEEGIPYQTLIWAILHKVANKKIEVVIK